MQNAYVLVMKHFDVIEPYLYLAYFYIYIYCCKRASNTKIIKWYYKYHSNFL